MTRTELINLTNENIGDNAFITPEKDREQRFAMIDYIDQENQGENIIQPYLKFFPRNSFHVYIEPTEIISYLNAGQNLACAGNIVSVTLILKDLYTVGGGGDSPIQERFNFILRCVLSNTMESDWYKVNSTIHNIDSNRRDYLINASKTSNIAYSIINNSTFEFCINGPRAFFPINILFDVYKIPY